jgi:hypothetical protein
MKSKKQNNPYKSFESTKKHLISVLWKLIPNTLKLPFVILVIILGLLISTQNKWLPIVDGFFNPNVSIIFHGNICNSAGAGIKDVDVKLVSLTNSIIISQAQTNTAGRFDLFFKRKTILQLIKDLESFKLCCIKKGYSSKSIDITISKKEINQALLEPIVMESSIYDELYPRADYCVQTIFKKNTVFFFDLNPLNTNSDAMTQFLNRLSHQLKYYLINHLEAQNLLGDELLDVEWCSGISVNHDDAAVTLGRRINACAVIWGYLAERNAKLETQLSFTLPEDSLTGITDIEYPTNDIFKLFKPEATPDLAYIAFSSYLLGTIHLKKHKNLLAKRCFLYAQQLKALPIQIDKVAALMLQKINEEDPQPFLDLDGGNK